MGKWMDLAARLQSRDNRDDRDDRPPNVPNVPNVPDTLPPALRQGLHRLKAMAAPAIVRSERWPGTVKDALSLSSEGWAQQALALGWSELDLFGAATGDDDTDGLSVWLNGRRLLAITKDFASAEITGGWAYFNRSTRRGGELLWNLGR